MASKQGNATKAENGVEVYENEIFFYLGEYENKWSIDCHDIDQNRWNSCLIYIGNSCYKHTNKLKLKPYDMKRNGDYTNNGKYDLDKVIEVLDIYIWLCYEYSKEITILGFSYISGIDRMTLYNWFNSVNNNNNSSSIDLSAKNDTSKAMYIYKTLQDGKQDTLSNRLYSSTNPVGSIAILNHDFGWNSSRTAAAGGNPQSIEDIQSKYLTSGTGTASDADQENGKTGNDM